MTQARRRRLPEEGRRRVVIEAVRPELDGGRFPVKRVVGEPLAVRADVFSDGHDRVGGVLRYRKTGRETWEEETLKPLGNDRWEARFTPEEVGRYEYGVVAWADRFATWQEDLRKKAAAGQEVAVDLRIGAALVAAAASRARGTPDGERLEHLSRELEGASDPEAAVSLALGQDLTRLGARWPDRSLATEYGRTLPLVVDPPLAGFSAWYEFFPRSCGAGPHGTLRDAERLLTEVARMGFDVVYLPPIHPIGESFRKGRNNRPRAEPGEPGSPWAIGSRRGGHQAVHPELGALADYERFVAAAGKLGMKVALDLAFQCSPDHPYVSEYPTWFRWRPDGTLQHAENPPKKYEDIVPLDFETPEWGSLWEELLGVVLFWVERGVKVFRVDNPHTKPFAFWEWLIREVKGEHPEVVFLSEAFTRPKVMQRLAKVGFSQSYTYFTWRNTKAELTEYLTELTRTEVREHFRPNFWPNTPDILPEYLQYGGRPAFAARLVLAATLSSNYGIYGPAFELCVAEAVPDKEEYLDSEKYEVKHWERDRPESLAPLVGRINRIRRENPALHSTWNLRFHEADNDNVLFYGKTSEDGSNALLIAVNLDPFRPQACSVRVPLDELGIAPGQPYLMHDLLGEDRFLWQGEWNRLELDPQVLPARIFRVRSRLRREQDFDYFL
ncbi:MAG: alpha-1,4-glucan--maltose-1-phosphate maltosyltransferase [Thermodesulfobacteriota bacterium]